MKRSVCILMLICCSVAFGGVGSDGTVFYDDFDGGSFNPAKWTVYSEGIGTYVVEVREVNDVNFAHFESFCDGVKWGDVSIETVPLTLPNLNEWAAEIRFRVGPWRDTEGFDGHWLSRGDPTWLGPGTDLPRQVELLTGRRNEGVGDFAITLFEDWERWYSYYPNPVPVGQESTTFYLAWSVFDGPTDATYLVPSNPNASKLNRNQWYTMVLHRNTGGEIDIYLDNVLLTTRSSFPDSLLTLEIGDISGQTGSNLDVDYVKLGVFVGGAPEVCGDPGTVYLDSDLNKDCRVDFADFALFTEKWLLCTDPADPINCI